MIVPGMSAGTVIILCGLYGVLLGHVSGFYKSKGAFWDAVRFFIPLMIGAVVGIFALSRALEFLINKFSLPVFALFAGLVLGSVPLVAKGVRQGDANGDGVSCHSCNNLTKKYSNLLRPHLLAPAILACALVIVLAIFSPPEAGVKELSVTTGIMLVIAGAASIAAMLIPGISGAFLLILMGYYETLLNAASNLNIPVLALFALGAPIGLFVAAIGIRFFLRRFRVASHMAIVGFLVGSVVGVFLYPGTYESATNAFGIVAACILFIAGFTFIMLLSRFQKEDFLRV